MALVLPPIPTDLVPLVGKPPRYTLRRLPYPGNTRPYYSYLKELDIEVPDIPEGVDPVDSTSGYDWKGLLSKVFDFETAEEALEWARLGIVEVINDLKEARALMTECADSVRHPSSEGDDGLGLAQCSKDLVEASTIWAKVVWRYWLWCAAARAFYARIPSHVLHDRRVTSIESSVQALNTDIGSLGTQVGSLDGKMDAIMRLLQGSGGGTRCVSLAYAFRCS